MDHHSLFAEVQKIRCKATEQNKGMRTLSSLGGATIGAIPWSQLSDALSDGKAVTHWSVE